MSTSQQELQRLLELKKQEELNQADLQERMKLEMKHKEFIKLSYEEMEAKLKAPPTEQLKVSGKSVDPIMAAYNEIYAEEEWYEEPKVEGNTVLLKFPTPEEAGKFFMKQSENGHIFLISDPKTNKVMAYSNGDGQLYHGDGQVFKAGEALKVADIDAKSFEIPGIESDPSARPS